MVSAHPDLTLQKINYYPRSLFDPWLETVPLGEILRCTSPTEFEKKVSYFSKAGQTFKTSGYTTGVLIRDSFNRCYYTAILANKDSEQSMSYRAALSYAKHLDDGQWGMPNDLLMRCIRQRLTPGLSSLRKIPPLFHYLSAEALETDLGAYWTRQEVDGPAWCQKIQTMILTIRSDCKLIRPIKLLRLDQFYHET